MVGVDTATDTFEESLDSVDSAEPYVRKAAGIAQHLHHARVQVAHLLLAIALTRNGAGLLDQYRLAPQDVRESCWRHLEKEPFIPDQPIDITPSDELNALLRHAASFASRSVLQAEHILRAITDVKLLGQFASLLQKAPQPTDTHEVVSEIRKRLCDEFPNINNRLVSIESAQFAAGGKIDLLQETVGSGNSDGNLHTAADRLKKRMTNVKSWVVLTGAIVTTALVVHIILTK